MKSLSLIICIILGIKSFAQQIEMPAEQYPFYSIIEWKGMGAILFNRDPAGNMKKVNMTLVGNKPTNIWQQSFNPNGKEFHFISSENSRYVYFLDNLVPEGGKISLHQLNSAGNIKSTSVVLSSAIKKLGAFDLSEMQLIDIITTDKALVHVFRYHDTKAKKFIEFATFITHHNLLVYSSILGEIAEEDIKEGNFGQWKYIGFTDDQIYFAARDFQNKKKGWTVQNLTSKGALTNSQFINGPIESFDIVEHIGVGANGKTILNNSTDSETATLIHHKNQFYITGIMTEGTSKTVKLKQLLDGKWVDLNNFKFTPDKGKTSLHLGNYILNEGIGCKIGNSMIFLPYDAAKKPNQTVFSSRYNSNPSRFIVEDKKELFTVSLSDGTLYFDLSQLNKSGNVKFEFIKK
jgi:hypothetical protein